MTLDYTEEVKAKTDAIYEKVKDHIPAIEWPVHAPYIAAINDLKKELNAVILAHNYQTPEIFYGVADLVGDSLALARMAVESDADVIVLCGVHFMAETAKILNPSRKVLIPDAEAGCSLADSITPEDVRALRAKYPGLPIATYVNTSAAVKAECDVCITSGNAVKVVESLGSDKVVVVPDEYLGKYIATQTEVEIILWQGHCEVHEKFTAADLVSYRGAHPEAVILAHPECPPDVLDEADFVGSTAGMGQYVADRKPEKVVMITECSMSDNLAVAHPEVNFVRPCALCPHMKLQTLPKILRALQEMRDEVVVDEEIAARARRAVERMLELS